MKTIIGELLREQLGTGFNCESDPTSASGFACVANQFGVGQFVDLPTCLASGCETVQGGCCDDCANFPANFVPDSNYHSIGRFCTGCAIAAGTNIVITNPSNPTQTFYGLTSNMSVHSVGTTANADGQDYCCDCCNQGHLPWPVSSIPSAAMNGCGDVVNGTTPKTQDPKNPLGVDKDFKGPKEKMPVGNNYDKKKITKKDVESIKEETNRFKQLISEQLGSGWNCEVDTTSPSGFLCVQNQFGAGQYVSQAACQAAGCESNGVCPAGHPWHGWPSGYPTNNDFVWNGPPINMNFGGSALNFPTGSILDGTYANWFNAGQSSYCEWCADYNSGGGTITNSQGFDLRTNYWVGGGYGPEACSCCPANNGMGQPLPRMAPIYKCSNGCEPTDEEEDTRGETYKSREECMMGCGIGEKETTQSVCCSWCETQKGGRPPKGCYDFDCDDCITKPVRLREDIENIRLLHKKHSKIKGNG